MVIDRSEYIEQLLAKRWNGKVKIVTGIRRSGKSFLLSTLFKNRLIEEGAGKEDFVEVALDKKSDAKYRNPNLLYDHIMERTQDMGRKFYVFIDEIQLSYKVKNEDVDESLVPEEDRDMLYTTFYDILNDLMTQPNIDLYVTGSNSKMLSKDIVTNFRDRVSDMKISVWFWWKSCNYLLAMPFFYIFFYDLFDKILRNRFFHVFLHIVFSILIIMYLLYTCNHIISVSY